MAIRIRRIEGFGLVALCAAETDEQPGDIYLDDGVHYALAAKFALDWQGQTVDWLYREEWAAMEKQKLRDAKEELRKWQREKDRYSFAVKCSQCKQTGKVGFDEDHPEGWLWRWKEAFLRKEYFCPTHRKFAVGYWFNET